MSTRSTYSLSLIAVEPYGFVVAEDKTVGDQAGRSMAAGVVLASGAGTRMGAEVNKAYLPLAGRRMVAWSLDAFARVPAIGTLVLVLREQDRSLANDALHGVDYAVELVIGGATRQESELRALTHLADRITRGDIDTVLLHDAARPLVSPGLIAAVTRAARDHGGAVPGLRTEDLLPVRSDGMVTDTPVTGVRVQTPQGFRARELLAAYQRAANDDFHGTDTAACVQRYSTMDVRWVPGAEENLKVTYPHELAIASRILAERSDGLAGFDSGLR